ncbi:MAG: hypothetical protein Ct9H300mP28_21560 [Pseudomonadota bacterium]|nr:MAG: hypothetical protein Ct9H300mP28_21560 [Pseudomonadota bacterium]
MKNIYLIKKIWINYFNIFGYSKFNWIILILGVISLDFHDQKYNLWKTVNSK